MPIPTLIVHGGCHDQPIDIIDNHLAGSQEAAQVGFAVLEETGSALQAVMAAVRVLEDNPLFDAGTGSYLNLLGEVEMDALLATSDGQLGGVAGIQRVQYPIDVAHEVMTRTPHVLLVGDGATQFARVLGFADYDPGCAETDKVFAEENKRLKPQLAELLPIYQQRRTGLKNTSTVGAVAIDRNGLMVAGTSTGGIPQKLPGRIGDAAIFGAGTFASPTGVASATGFGEGIIRLGVTRAYAQALETGKDPEQAALEVIKACTAQHIACGIIGLDKNGSPVAHHNGTFMPSHYQQTGMTHAEVIGTVRGRGEYLG
jgi:beta-aspartyl-peptidase (threonine type)